MRNERKYKIISLLTTILMLMLLGNCAREYYRMEATEEWQIKNYVAKGATVYAENCMQCHGPKGEGVVGMPLNRAALRVDHNTPAGKDVYRMIYTTLVQGRKGSDVFKWVRAPDGKWMSYSTMPAWHKDNGGPFDDEFIKAITLFVMNPDGSQWNGLTPPKADVDLDKVTGVIPLTVKSDLRADDPDRVQAEALLRNIPKSLCLSCHTIGAKGGKVGPDLTRVGSWGIDQPFLENWIKYANVPGPDAKDQTPAVPHDQRMPVYWSANRATQQPELNLKTATVSEGPYFMPRFKDGTLSDEEISLIAKYLLSLH